MKLAKIALLGLLPLAAAVAPAYADTVTFDWTLTSPATADQGGFPLLGSGTLTATTGLNGEDTVTGITGNVGDETITGLTSFDFSDNLLYPSGTTYLSTGGLGFTTSTGENLDVYSFFGQGSTPSGNAYGEITSGHGFGVGLFNLTPVPLPASWTLLLTGLAGFGALALRRKGAFGNAF